jgi:hypothetical protein
MVNGLRKGLAEAGFVEGRNLTIEYAWTDGQSERLSALATELVGRRVPVIVSSALNATESCQSGSAHRIVPAARVLDQKQESGSTVSQTRGRGGLGAGQASLRATKGRFLVLILGASIQPRKQKDSGGLPCNPRQREARNLSFPNPARSDWSNCRV